MREAAREERAPPGDRLPALLQPGLPRRVRRDHQGGRAGRRLPRAPGLAPQRELAAQGRAAVAGLRPLALGISDLRPPRQLAPVLAVLEGSLRRARQPSGERGQLVLRSRARVRAVFGRPLPLQGGREVYDHVYSTFEYPGGRTAMFSSIESNAFDHYYEMFMGTKGTLILRGETEHYLFDANDDLVEAGVGRPAEPERRASRSRSRGRGHRPRRLREPHGRRRGRSDGRGSQPERGAVLVRARWPRTAWRFPDSARPSGWARSSPAGRTRPSSRPGPASWPTRPWRRRRGCGCDRNPSAAHDRLTIEDRHAARCSETRTPPHQTGVRLPHAAQRHHEVRALAAGERLVIDDLARRLEVSAIPVREALQLLQSEGLVVNVPSRGCHGGRPSRGSPSTRCSR